MKLAKKYVWEVLSMDKNIKKQEKKQEKSANGLNRTEFAQEYSLEQKKQGNKCNGKQQKQNKTKA